ncbi:D-2-hydroxyacid dehydrogenase [Glaciecola petra]|uniref:D-2-hydroxyacid dehydrogenase n=1 Tax=Glaciecola petra TaxID=3075602 RepID=A0ABU2ZW21_9ALTE|nr:D-2-hydroxyacid dehydrogenase [Aestuariibacter sp. P117]MDT0596499.1 D-2-hydroxyacid dehydrogenase [Aestuariibacter sp. P117]
MKKIVFLDADTLGHDIEMRKPNFQHIWQSYPKTQYSELFDRANEADIIITNKVNLDANTLAQLPKLTHVAVAATGTNCVDLIAAKNLNIGVSNVPGYGTNSVVEHVYSMILALRKGLIPYKQDIKDGKWQQSEQFCFYNQSLQDIRATTIGIVGTGSIALAVAKIAEAFGMHVMFHSVSGRTDLPGYALVNFEELLQHSDIVSIHCPLSPKSENMFGPEAFTHMKPNALLINTARGSIVNLDALYEALLERQLAGAGIDVATQEPPDNDAAILKLNHLPNCIVTPHTAWASEQARQVLVEEVIQNIEAAASDQARNIVNA